MDSQIEQQILARLESIAHSMHLLLQEVKKSNEHLQKIAGAQKRAHPAPAHQRGR